MHLRDKQYVEEINQLIKEVIAEYALLPYRRDKLEDIPLSEIQFSIPDDVLLDFLLMKIRSKSIAYGSMKKKQANYEEKQLISELEELETKVQTLNNIEIIAEKQIQLQNIRDKRMEGVLLRSKARYIAEGEKVTKYFCNMEKINFVSKTMSKLVKQDGTVINKKEEIEEEANGFYEQLYKKRNVQGCEISDLVRERPQLSQEEANPIEGELNYKEAGRILKHMANLKSPGSDGFTVEFFKFFWGKIGHLVVRALNASFRKGELSTVQKEGIIICLPKGDKPREYIKNWRPISLLNVVYKIGSACIAARIKTVLPKLVSEDQTGFMSGRYIGDNLRLIYDIIAHLDSNNLPGLLLNIDFEKAFDSLD